MKKLYILVILLFLTTNMAYAKKYAVKKLDGEVATVNYIESSSKSLDDFLSDVGLGNLPIIEVTDQELESNEKKYRKISGGKLSTDTIKKQSDVDKAAQEQSDKEAILAKLKLTEEEYKKLNKSIKNG